jgi:hypothetical protein
MKTKDEILTAVEWIFLMLNNPNSNQDFANKLLGQAKKMEREQHGRTWDAAIQAHEDRGHVLSRSLTDFDEYQIK